MIDEHDDIRAESLIAYWLENGVVAKGNVVVKSQGSFNRPVGKDISRIDPPVPVQDQKVTVHINREGLYDMLPEGLFHQVTRKTGKATEESVEQTQRYKTEEKAARKFFLPLEQEFYRHKVSAEQAELSACLGSATSDHVNAFITFWDLPGELLSYEQKNFMLAILPQVHRIVGSIQKVATCLQILLGEEVTIRGTGYSEVVGGQNESTLLGNTLLGVDSVLPAEFNDDEVIEVRIGPISLRDLPLYLAYGDRDRLLSRLYRFFFQAEDCIVSTIVLEDASGGFSLNEEEHLSRLGFTTVLP